MVESAAVSRMPLGCFKDSPADLGLTLALFELTNHLLLASVPPLLAIKRASEPRSARQSTERLSARVPVYPINLLLFASDSVVSLFLGRVSPTCLIANSGGLSFGGSSGIGDPHPGTTDPPAGGKPANDFSVSFLYCLGVRL